MQRSILGQLLPEAMICFLENHGETCMSVCMHVHQRFLYNALCLLYRGR